MQWQPDGLTLHQKWFTGAGFLGAPPISLMLFAVSPRSTTTTTTQRGWYIEAFVSILARLQSQKWPPGGGGV